MAAVTAVSARDAARALAAFADTAAFTMIVASVVAVPLTFSVADADVFALPKTILTVGLASAVGMLLTVRWLAAGRTALPDGRDPLMLAVSCFIACNVLATWVAVDPGHAVAGEPLQHQGLIAFAAYAVLLLGAWTTVRGARRRRTLLTAVVVSAAFVSGYAVLQRFGLDPIWSALHEGRVFSTVGQPNALGAYLVLALPIVVVVAPGRGLGAQLTLSAVALLLLGAVALTLSRGAFLGTAVAILVMTVTLAPRWRQVVNPRLVAIGTAAALAAAAVVLVVPDVRAGAGAAVGRVLDPGRVEHASASAHLDQWAVGLAIALDRPLAGGGPDSYVLLFHEYRDEVLPSERAEVWARYRPESPHNVYLAIADGAGLVAVGAYLLIIVVIARRLVRVIAEAKLGTAIVASGVLAAVAGNLVTDFFITAETTESAVMWILLGTGAAIHAGIPSPRVPPAVAHETPG